MTNLSAAAGMVLKIEPIIKAISKIKPACRRGRSEISNLKNSKIILLSPSGKQFTQKMAQSWAKKYDNLILICGRYEGVDARVKKVLKAEEISVGPYIITGGELPAVVLVDSISRQIQGVLGKEESLEEERGMSGFPVYTKPEVFEYRGKKI